MVALDAAGNTSASWPYLTVGAPSTPPASGHPAFPFASEDRGFGPRLAATGFGVTQLQPGVPGTVTLLATSAGDEVDEIRSFLDGTTPRLTTGMNDSGIAPDQVAGDGLFTGQVTLTLPLGSHVIDMLPRREAAQILQGPGAVMTVRPPDIGDAYPRFRVHGH